MSIDITIYIEKFAIFTAMEDTLNARGYTASYATRTETGGEGAFIECNTDGLVLHEGDNIVELFGTSDEAIAHRIADYLDAEYGDDLAATVANLAEAGELAQQLRERLAAAHAATGGMGYA